MRSQAQVVIIGAGVVGCSVAYYLTQMGWRDVVVLEQGPLYKVYGSTSHAPGLIFQHNNSKSYCQIAQWTVEIYKRVNDLNAAPEKCAWQVGSLEIAQTPERWHELKRKIGNAKAWGLEAHLVTPDEIKQLVPIMRVDDLYGAFYVPSDMDIKAIALLQGITKLAEDGGAEFFDYTRVTGIDVTPANGRAPRVRAVKTNRGEIQCEYVICAAGLWGPVIGEMAGVPIPQTPCEHLYLRTMPIAELQNAQDELEMPIVRAQDRDLYFRQHRNAWGGGSYAHEPRINFADELREDDHPALTPAPPQNVEAFMSEMAQRFPATAHAQIADAFNGMFTFTPDANMNLGESMRVKNFWSAEAVWVTHGGGVGRVIAEWLTTGVPPLDMREHDINRWHSFAFSKPYIRARAERQYIEIYDIVHPLQQTLNPRGIRVTSFHEREKALGAEFFEAAGWERPQWYNSNSPLLAGEGLGVRSGWAARYWSPIIAAEHRATRERVGLFDLTAFTKLRVEGKDALSFLQRVAANQMDRPLGHVTYTAMCNERGGIETDLTVTRVAHQEFLVVTGGGMGMHDLAWLKKNLRDDENVMITDVTSSYATLGLWGPRARDLIEKITRDDFSNKGFPYVTSKEAFIGYVPVRAIRISYAGELGWELYTPTEYALKLWDTIWDAGQQFGIAAVGGGAFESLRIEKGYRFWGSDIHAEYNPYEAGLGFAVKLNKGDFIGRDALQKIKSKGITRKLVAMTFDDPQVIVMGKEPIVDFASPDKVLGYVTSANFGYTVGKSIAYGYVPIEYANEGTKVKIYYFGEWHGATATREPLYDGDGRRLRS
ncbi:MAG: FAD-dependent oxidoreductase [Chloroflexota bacterium]|nr:MAG: FAD-dependent oxidoreductase [Chloroflexota bacterium]